MTNFEFKPGDRVLFTNNLGGSETAEFIGYFRTSRKFARVRFSNVRYERDVPISRLSQILNTKKRVNDAKYI